MNLAWLADLCAALAVPGLGTYGVTEARLEQLVDKAAAASSMKGNPIELTRVELLEVLRRAV
jgi:alcohol dehydrogenase class IV